MRRRHAVALSLVLAGGSIAGVLAATRTAHLAGTQRQSSRPDPAVAARSRKLDQLEASLRRALASKPPELPPVPRYAPVPIPELPAGPAVTTHTVAETPPPAPAQPARPAPAAATTGKVIYVRPKPIVKYVRPAPAAAPAARPGRGDDGEHGESGLGEGGESGGESGSVLADGRPSLDQAAAFDGGEE